jgi:glycosyltransferase involved in cell wall biosynthesis
MNHNNHIQPTQRGDSTLPLVSAIMPVYNSEKYITETLDSVCAQTYRNLEIVIVDDGCTDSTPEIIKKKMAACPNIVFIRQKNAGVSAARNRAIRESRGDYVAFIDSDDLWEPTKIETQVGAMQETGMKACYCGQINLFDHNGSRAVDKFKKISGDILVSFLRNEVWPMTSTWIINRSIILENDIRFHEGTSWGEDGEFFIKIAALADVCAVEDKLTIYRIRKESLSGYKINHRNLVDVWARTRDWLIARPGLDNADYCARIIDDFRIPSVIIQCLYEEKKLGIPGGSDYFAMKGFDVSRIRMAGIIRHCNFFMDSARLVLMKLAATSDAVFKMIRIMGDIIYMR